MTELPLLPGLRTLAAPPMTLAAGEDIFKPTALGEGELRGGLTRLRPGELALLVRFDGQLTWEQVLGTLPATAHADAEAACARLLARGFLAPVELDALSRQLHSDARLLGATAGRFDADQGLAALRRAGFCVQIARERQARPARAEAANVVLVEDDAMLAHFTRAFLALAGHAVRVASHRAEIIEQIRRPPRPDLFLLDVELPDADGFDILRRIREHPVLHDVPVIMLTGRATRAAVIRGLAEGADGYITKPFDPETLLQAVRTVLGEPAPCAPRASHPAWANRDALQRRSC